MTTTAAERSSMDCLVLTGGRPLAGSVEVAGAKNAALPLMAATLLAPGVHVLTHGPRLADTRTMGRVLEALGAKCTWDDGALTIDTSTCSAGFDAGHRSEPVLMHRYAMMADDSVSTTSPSTSVGAFMFGLSLAYSGARKPPPIRSTSMHCAGIARCLTSASTRSGACALIQ